MSEDKKTYLPVVSCPECLDNSCYPTELAMSCDKCGAIYPVNIKYFNNRTFFDFDNFRLEEYLKSLNDKKNKIDSFNNSLMKNIIANEDSLDSFSVVFSGKTLELLKKIKSENNIPSLMLTIKLIFEGFIYLIKELKSLPGQKVYLVDSFGNKSDDVKRNILKTAYDIFSDEQNRDIVKSFMEEMDIKFIVDDVKKEQNGNGTSQNTGKK